MPAYYVRIGPKIVRWSTIVDAPTHSFDSVEQVKEFHLREFGTSALRPWANMAKRLEVGTSSTGEDADSLIWLNRAGKGETTLTKAQLVAYAESGWRDQPVGVNTLDHPEDWWTPARFKGEENS